MIYDINDIYQYGCLNIHWDSNNHANLQEGLQAIYAYLETCMFTHMITTMFTCTLSCMFINRPKKLGGFKPSQLYAFVCNHIYKHVIRKHFCSKEAMIGKDCYIGLHSINFLIIKRMFSDILSSCLQIFTCIIKYLSI